jgi:hypothetical protein
MFKDDEFIRKVVVPWTKLKLNLTPSISIFFLTVDGFYHYDGIRNLMVCQSKGKASKKN